MALGFIVLDVVLMIKIALLMPIMISIVIKIIHQLYAGVVVAHSIAKFPAGDSSTSN
jgi:hypothetical protein